MTRLAILADIHGNVAALEAVLDDLAAQRVDEVLVGGDLVGRGPEGSRVVRRIRALGFPAIGGNHEDYLLGFRRGAVPSEWYETEEWAASRWMAAELSEDDLAYAAALPFARVRPGLRLVHGTPYSNREGIGPWTTDEQIAAHLAAVPEPVLVCAHTHRSLVRETAGGLVVNVGSVGLPFNDDQRAQYAILHRDGAGDRWRAELRQVPYDLERTLAVYEASGFLAHGGITARLLRLELLHARPLLVPFLSHARARGVTPVEADIEPFLRDHPHNEPPRRASGAGRRPR
jgi:predicted phosphodiesterase